MTQTSSSMPQSIRMQLRRSSVAELLACTSERVRTQPGNARLRWELVELLCLESQWDRALRQLQTWAALAGTADSASTAQLYRNLIASEMLRVEVLAGRKTPRFIDPPSPWVLTLLSANEQLAAGNHSASDTARLLALDNAKSVRGRSESAGAFTWLTDTDTRLGPICEFVTAGGYRWFPFEQLLSVRVNPPASLLDAIWCPASLQLADRTLIRGYIPSRYPASATATDDIKLGRATNWTDSSETAVLGHGQKTWATDQGDWGMLHLGECTFEEDRADGPV